MKALDRNASTIETGIHLTKMLATVPVARGSAHFLCDESGTLIQANLDDPGPESALEFRRIHALFPGIGPILECAPDCMLRTELEISTPFRQWLETRGFKPKPRLNVHVSPLFCDEESPRYISIIAGGLLPFSPGSRIHQLHQPIGGNQAPWILVDIRTDLPIAIHPTFETWIAKSRKWHTSARMAELGLSEMMTQGMLNANRGTLFRAPALQANDCPPWILAETLEIARDRDCLLLWALIPSEIAEPRPPLPTPLEHLTTYPDAEHFGRSLTCLICDNEELVRESCSCLLEHMGHRSLLAASGLGALQTLEKSPVDLILLDIHMPRLNGFDAARIIRDSHASYASIPIVAMTGSGFSGNIHDPQFRHFDACLRKPFDLSILCGVLLGLSSIPRLQETLGTESSCQTEREPVAANNRLSGVPPLAAHHPRRTTSRTIAGVKV